MELKSLFKTSSHFTTSIFVASDSFVDISFNVRGIPRRKMLSSFFNAIVCSTHLNKGLEMLKEKEYLKDNDTVVLSGGSLNGTSLQDQITGKIVRV